MKNAKNSRPRFGFSLDTPSNQWGIQHPLRCPVAMGQKGASFFGWLNPSPNKNGKQLGQNRLGNRVTLTRSSSRAVRRSCYPMCFSVVYLRGTLRISWYPIFLLWSISGEPSQPNRAQERHYWESPAVPLPDGPHLLLLDLRSFAIQDLSSCGCLKSKSVLRHRLDTMGMKP